MLGKYSNELKGVEQLKALRGDPGQASDRVSRKNFDPGN